MTVIDKASWILIENGKVLFVRTQGKDKFYFPGGKREGDETDAEALFREVSEELSVQLVPETLRHVRTVSSPAHGQVEGMMVESKCYFSDYTGKLTPSAEVVELAWFGNNDREHITETGHLIMDWLHTEGLITSEI